MCTRDSGVWMATDIDLGGGDWTALMVHTVEGFGSNRLPPPYPGDAAAAYLSPRCG